jgi:hypothetical protein
VNALGVLGLGLRKENLPTPTAKLFYARGGKQFESPHDLFKCEKFESGSARTDSL